MLNTDYFVRDEKYSRKHVYILFIFRVSFGEEGKKKMKNTANTTLKLSEILKENVSCLFNDFNFHILFTKITVRICDQCLLI